MVDFYGLNLAQGLLRADDAILQGSGIFWGLTINGSLELAQMTVARLYDKMKEAVTVPAMLTQARSQSSQFQRCTQQEVDGPSPNQRKQFAVLSHCLKRFANAEMSRWLISTREPSPIQRHCRTRRS
jgi:hypothetical protein